MNLKNQVYPPKPCAEVGIRDKEKERREKANVDVEVVRGLVQAQVSTAASGDETRADVSSKAVEYDVPAEASLFVKERRE
jgi:hypothetical protein